MRGQYVFASLGVAFLLGKLAAKKDTDSKEKAVWNPVPGDECNLANDQYLMVNPGKQNTFLQCSPAKRGVIGVWKAMPCPPGQTFQFGKQRCDSELSSVQVTAGSSSEDFKQKRKRRSGDDAPRTIVPTHISYAGQPCNDSYCFGGSTCDEKTKLCKCPHGTTATNGSLYCQAIVDQVTLDERHPLNDLKKFTTASPGSSCGNGEKCTGGSVCNADNGVCTCGEGMVDREGICTALVIKHKNEPSEWKDGTSALQGGTNLDDQCGPTTSCSNGGQCVNGRCVCVAPLIRIQNKCVLMDAKPIYKALPGEFCDNGQHCQGGSVCSSVTLRCACPMGTKQSGKRCVEAPAHKGVLAAVGDYCEVNTDCINGAYCHSGSGRPRCECLSTHVEIDRTCFKVVYPGQQGCSNDKQCAAAYHGATCVNSVCTCPPGSTAIAQTCSEGAAEIGTVPLVEVIPKYPSVFTGSPPGGLCSELINCLGGSLCNSGVCICPEKLMQVVDGRCVVSQPQPVSSSAILEVHHKVGNQKTFVPVGSPCGNTIICVGGAVCVDGTCQCSKGLRQVQNRCVREQVAKVQPIPGPKVILPEPVPLPREAPYCLNDDMCNGRSICIYSKCSCPAGTMLLNDHCMPVQLNIFKASTKQSTPRGTACIRDEECAEGSMCVQGVCQCPPRFRRLIDGSCSGAILDSSCTTDRSCGDQAICINGHCHCPPGSVRHGDLCILVEQSNLKRLSPPRSSVLPPICPNEMSPVVDPVSREYVKCNARTLCPIGSFCSPSRGQLHPASFYCCPVNRNSRKWTRVS